MQVEDADLRAFADLGTSESQRLRRDATVGPVGRPCDLMPPFLEWNWKSLGCARDFQNMENGI